MNQTKIRLLVSCSCITVMVGACARGGSSEVASGGTPKPSAVAVTTVAGGPDCTGVGITAASPTTSFPLPVDPPNSIKPAGFRTVSTPPGMVTTSIPQYNTTTTGPDPAVITPLPPGVVSTDTTAGSQGAITQPSSAPSPTITTVDLPGPTTPFPAISSTVTTGADVVETTTTTVPGPDVVVPSTICGASQEVGFGTDLSLAPIGAGKYTLSPFSPEGRVAVTSKEPGLHRTYVLSEGIAGNPTIAYITADHQKSVLAGPGKESFEKLWERTDAQGVDALSGDFTALQYVDRSRPDPIDVLVLDYPQTARITIRAQVGHNIDELVAFAESADLRKILGF